jgi:hypothetical protein
VKNAVEMGSSAMSYAPSFIKTGSVIQKLLLGDTQTHRKEMALTYIRKVAS